MENQAEKTVTISEREYQRLLFIEAQINALEAAGIDNWDGYNQVDWPDEDDYFVDEKTTD